MQHVKYTMQLQMQVFMQKSDAALFPIWVKECNNFSILYIYYVKCVKHHKLTTYTN